VEIPVTNDTDPGIVNGKAVHRVEFGIYKGIFWSPKGNYLAFYRKDETMVTDYPLVDIDTRIAEEKDIKYPMAGMKSHEVTLGVYDINNERIHFINTGEPKDQYLTSVTWSPDEQFIFIALLNRDQNHLKLNKYDALTGQLVKTLFEEKDKEWVEPEHELYFLNSKPDQFVWFSERNGFNHLYLYDIDGNLIKQLTKGNFTVTEYLGSDPKDKTIFYISNEENPIEKQIYMLDVKSGEKIKLTSIKGTHNGIPAKSGKYILNSYSSFSEDIAREYALIDIKGNVKQILLENKDPLSDYNLGETSVFTIKNDEDQELYCRMIKPHDFDPEKKYPVFLYVYGGPHSQLVTDSWLAGGGLFLNYMAQQGYVVFTLDNRGTANRGIEFEQAIHRNLGKYEVEDQVAGINYLKTLDFVDPDRIGVNGWSYGGFMTISLMLKHPEIFKVGVCGGPVTDWKYYEVMYGERYMDTPQDNPEGYEESSLINKTANLDGKLLVIHGTEDPTVVWQHSLVFLQNCIKSGKQLDYFVYPGHGHGVRGKDRLHLNIKMANYIFENL
jgi:dipeptidyl-peptidase-4